MLLREAKQELLCGYDTGPYFEKTLIVVNMSGMSKVQLVLYLHRVNIIV